MAARPLIRGSDVTAKKLATGTFPTFFKIKVFRFIDKLDVYDRRHFLKAERSSRTAKRSLRHYVITLLHQSGVFPKIASQLDYELKLDLKRLSWEEAHVWGMCFLSPHSLLVNLVTCQFTLRQKFQISSIGIGIFKASRHEEKRISP